MTRDRIAVGASAAVLGALVFAAGHAALDRTGDPPAAADPVTTPDEGTHEGLLYGRVTTDEGTVYEGRLRWGGDQEALWGHPFNGFKDENPWVEDVPVAQFPTEHAEIRIFGRRIAGWERDMNLSRPFMARFGDLARIERHGGDIDVTLKSGSSVVLDRMGSDDLGDGLRVWDGTRGVVDLVERQIRTVELLAAPGAGGGPRPIHGTVRTGQGDFTGLIQWNREQGLGSDVLIGRSADDVLTLPFDTIRSIVRRSPNGSVVTLVDGGGVVLTGTRDVGNDNRGVYVDDPRYGRVLISWEVFERADFSPGGTGPAYGDFPLGRPLSGTVVTRSGRRLTGRLVFDLDESETTETLDAPWEGVDYMIPFGLIRSIELPRRDGPGARSVVATLNTGEELSLEAAGDLGEGNAGMLVFPDGGAGAQYVRWADVDELAFERPPEMYPPIGPG